MVTKNDIHNLIMDKANNICQIAISKDDKLIYNDTFHDYKETDNCHVMSVTKSIVSLLIGIAIDQKLIKSVDQYVLDFFPDYQIKRGEKTIQQVTFRHLLTMTAPYKYKHEPWSKVCSSEDWTVAALDLLGGRAGFTGEFKYSTLGIHILTGLISRMSGMPVVEFANKYLFAPLEIPMHKNYLAETVEEHKEFTISKTPKDTVWFCDPKGVGTAGYGLCFSAMDLLKIGEMCLQDGMFHGKRIVSKEWIQESTRVNMRCGEQWQDMLYGYLWWIIDEEKQIYAAIGNSGNVIYVNRMKGIVVGITAYFKPTVMDRIPFIRNEIEPLLAKANYEIYNKL